MYEVKNVLKVVQDYIKHDNEELTKRKENISNTYFMAKLDIKVIENYEDTKRTMESIEKQLNELQERIIKRNREKN